MVRDLLLGNDAEAMRRYCIERFGVDPQQHGMTLVGVKQNKCFPYHGDEGNICWIKNRFAAAGVFKHRGEFACDADTARLHVFFIHIEETAAMVSRLLRDDAMFSSQVARSKLPNTNLKVRPIDSLAQSVAPFPSEQALKKESNQ